MKFKISSLLLAWAVLGFSAAFGQTAVQTQATTDCVPSPWELSIHAAPSIPSLKSDQYSSEESSKFGLSSGLDLAYYFKRTGKLKIAASIGAGYNYYSIKRSLDMNSSVWTYDYANDKVQIVETGSLAETQKVSYLNLPLKLRFDYGLSPKLDLYFNAGYFYGLALSKSFSSDAVLSRKGYYPATNCWVFDVDVDGAHYFYPTNKAISTSGDLKVKNSSGMELELGVKYRINPKLSFFVGAKMVNGFGSIADYSSNPEYTYANNQHQMNSLMERNDKITAKSIGIEFGLAMRLGKCKPNAPVVADNTPKLDSIKKEVKDTAKVVVQEVKDTVKAKPVVVVVEEQVKKDEQVKTDIQQKITVIAGKDDIEKISGPVNLSFVDEKGNLINGPLNAKPQQVYTLAELNLLLANGAPITKKIYLLQRIEFETNTTNLTEESKVCLDQLIDFMKKQPGCSLTIYGNTDNVGRAEYNKILSQKRAQVVVDYIAARQVAKSRLKAIGNGLEKPIDTNDTPEGRKNNRRVDFEIIWK